MCECCGKDDKGITIQVIKPDCDKKDAPPVKKTAEAENK